MIMADEQEQQSSSSPSSTSSQQQQQQFPFVDLIPKKETQVLDFLKKHPKYDGRNVRIGIFDTGIFPGAHCINYMSDGSTPKLVDVVDCTGAGDIDVKYETDAVLTNPEETADTDGDNNSNSNSKPYWKVTGLTGRTLKLSSDWSIEPFPVAAAVLPPIDNKNNKKEGGDDNNNKEEGGGAAGEEKETAAADDKDDNKGDESAGEKEEAAAVTTEESTTKSGGEEDTTGPKEGKEKEQKKNQKTVKVRLGVKRAYDIFPQRLVTRVKEERTKLFQKQVDEYIANVHKQLSTVRDRASDGGGGNGDNNNAATAAAAAAEQAKEKEDLEARLEVLNDKNWCDDDPGPVYDCVVFYDGTNYRAVVDVKEDGNLIDMVPMTSFSTEKQFGTFGVIDQMNYAVNFYHDGTVLSLVCDSSPHGTHVAGIAAAAATAESGDDNNDDDVIQRSGVAPGAELIGFVIGDVRLGTMETGAALARAMGEAARLKCDIVNLSFGEGSCKSNAGRFVELAEELVWKHNITFVSSAGNDGPALTTVKAPGGTSSAIIGVAAAVSPDMMKAEYSLPLKEGTTQEGQVCLESSTNHEQFKGTTYTWSSVGPADDGHNGICISGPGGAITSVPHWCLQKTRLMNGTSMSSPNVTGCISLLISACKAEAIPISPMRLRRAIENTAKEIPGLAPYQQGAGMIQVDQAYEYLKMLKDNDTEDIHFHISVENRPGKPRGIYLRQLDETSSRRTFAISVDPQFRREEEISEESQKRKINFEMSFNIEATESWVTAPSAFHIMNGGRSFKVEVDPTGLLSGVHTARVCGYDASSPDRKVMFSIPITVVKPMPPRLELTIPELQIRPAQVQRHFLVPPPGSTWMDVAIQDLRPEASSAEGDSDSSARILILHTTQLLSHAAQRDNECNKYITLLPSQQSVTSIAVEEGVTVEVDIGRLWSTIGETKVSVSIKFRGVKPVPSSVHMVAGSGGSLVRLYSHLKDESVSPQAKLTKWRTPLRPKGTPVIAPLTDRDVMPKKTVYELVLTYEFSRDDSAGATFTIRCPTLDGVLYESAFENHVMLVFDSEKKYLGASSNHPTPITAPNKGTVTIRVQVRHQDPKKLEDMKQMCIWIERNLEKDIVLPPYVARDALVYSSTNNGNKFKKKTLRKGSSTAVFISEPATSKIPSSCKAGDLMLGSVTYGAGEGNLSGEGKKPGGFPIYYTVGTKPPKSSNSDSPAEASQPKDERTFEQKIDEAVRDLKVSRLDQLTKEERKEGRFDELYSKLEADYPGHLPLLMARLKYLDTHEKRDDMLTDVIAASDAVVSQINQDEIALHFGKKSDSDDPKAVKERNEMKEKRTNLIEALARKAMASADSMNTPDDGNENFQEALKSLKEWVDIDSNDTKYAALVIKREEIAGRYGTILKLLNKLLKNNSNGGGKDAVIRTMSKSDILQKRQEILTKLGYTALVEYDKRTRIISCPKSFMLF